MHDFTIYDVPIPERPRERLKTVGKEALSAAELLTVLMGRGSAGTSVMTVTQRLLQKFGTLKNIGDASLEELCAIKGIGFAKACQLKAAFELGRRAEDGGDAAENLTIQRPAHAVEILFPHIKDKKKEHVFVLLLNVRKKLIKRSLISIGTLDASIIHPRDIFKEAISHFAAGFILAHNHPSGDPSPSKDDIALTEQFIAAAKFLDIAFLDHIVLGNPHYYSFKEKQEKMWL